MEFIAVILSILAIGLSAYAIIYNKLKAQALDVRMNELAHDEMEDQNILLLKAKVRATYVKTKPGSYTLKIFNAGPGIARNVNIQFNPRNYNDLVDLSNFPCHELNPEDSTEIYMNVHNERPDYLGIKLQWDDEFDFNNEHMQVIPL